MRVVIDTNVLVSGLWRPSGNCAVIVDAVRTWTLVAVLDDRIYAEYAGVLRRPKLGFPAATVERVLGSLPATPHVLYELEHEGAPQTNPHSAGDKPPPYTDLA